MKKISFLLILGYILFSFGCNDMEQTPRSKHVILIGLDGMGAYDFQRASTPCMNAMAMNGAISIKERCVLESSSSQNWMSMLTGAIPIQHGVTSNEWEPDNHNIEPSLKNKKGFFPSIFDDIKNQKPEDKVYMFYEWNGLGRMFDLSVPDKTESLKSGVQVMNKAVESFFNDKPEFIFIAIDETDHIGHLYGHESREFFDCISKYDSLIGNLAARLKKEGMLENTVVIITADHGGIEKGHGGETPYEIEIPILLYGGPVTKGKVIEQVNIIADIAPTVAGLLGISMPSECVGKFIWSAFQPKTETIYSPVPFISPRLGFYKDSVRISMRSDSPGAKIYYTTDGSEPTSGSILYLKPFSLSKSANVKAISITGNTPSKMEESSFRIAGANNLPAVHYKYFENCNEIIVPDFKRLGRPDRTGMMYEFSLAELNLKDKDHFAVEFSSVLEVEIAGEYLFSINSDDGSKLFIDDHLFINNDGSHGRITKSDKIRLEKGLHKIRVGYFDDYADEFLQVRWKSPSGNEEVLPFNRLKL
jgi:hypothetical protein